MKPRNTSRSRNFAANTHSASSEAILTPPRGPAARSVWLPISVAVLGVSSWLIFFHLGSYCLWGDEADTVLFARGIARTGDTYAVIDHNVYGYRDGALLKNLYGRYQPPLPYYIAAPFVGKEGVSTFWARFPFALFGLASVAFMLWWMSRSQLSTAFWIVFAIALLGNVSFFLFSRQCRYFSLAILLSLVIAWLYLNWNGRNWMLIAALVASLLLFATTYLAHVALYAVLGCDYLLFGRRKQRFTLRQALVLLVPQVVIGTFILWIYNPFGASVVAPAPPGRNVLIDHLTLIWYFFRDLNNSELCVGMVILAAPLLYLCTSNVWLLRGSVAAIIYTLATALLQPYPVTASFEASVRYVVCLLPLCIALSSLVIVMLAGGRWQIALPLAVFVFGCNILNFPFSPDKWCSRPVQFVREICSPRPTSTSAVVDWINENVRPGESIWVMPEYMQYSLMYHSPHARYVWQFPYPPQRQFEGLHPIYFIGHAVPDYFVMFGPHLASADGVIEQMSKQGIEYKRVKVLNIYWDDRIRPEIVWRAFEPKQFFNPRTEAVYLYRREKSGTSEN